MWLRGGTLDVHMEVVCSKQVAAYVLCETDIDWKTQVVERVEFEIAKDDVVRWPQATYDILGPLLICSYSFKFLFK